jgi:cytochrome d ubiquinol oxidase subunit II
METLWFVLVAAMLTGYVVLDGFDLGVGALYRVVAKTPEERAAVRQSIGPVWDANEVWLVAGAGTLYFAFPALYASAFSGFYLPLMLVLWMLIGRALGLELRGHMHEPLGRELCETVFVLSSLLLTFVLGVAFGNVIRGVPLDGDGYFFLPLWTTFRPGPEPGVLDWYTVLCGVVAAVALGTHGAHYLNGRVGGQVQVRAAALARLGSYLLPALTLFSLLATLSVRPSVVAGFRARPAGWLLPAAVAGALGVMAWAVRKGRAWTAFGASCAYLTAMLGSAAFALFPVLLPSSGDPARALTVHGAATGGYAMRVGAIWWFVAFVLVLAVFTYLYRSFRGRIEPGAETSYH